MGIADVQAAFGQPAPAAASAPLQVFQPQPAAAPAAPPPAAMQVPAGYRPIRTAFGDALLPDSAPLPPGAQYLDPATGQPYPPLNPPGETQALVPVAPSAALQPAPAAPQAVAPSPFVPTPAAPASPAPSATAAAQTPAPAVEAVLPADPAPKGRRRRSAPTEAAAPGAAAPAPTSASSAFGVNGHTVLTYDPGAAKAPAAVHEYAAEGLGAFSTEDLRDELKRRGWQVALGEAQ